MSSQEKTDVSGPTTSLEVRSRLVEALKLALVGPGPGHALAAERLFGWERPSILALAPPGPPALSPADAPGYGYSRRCAETR